MSHSHATTRVARLERLDGPDGIVVDQLETFQPGSGEVALDMRALGLNRAEALFARGQYLVEPDLPNPMGFEGVGVVADIGDGVTGLERGDRRGVLTAQHMRTHGVAADRIVVPAETLLPDVPTFGDVELAAFWVAYLTAFGGMIQTGELKRGETVLITAASSSVGIAAIQIAKRCGARAVASTRTTAKRDRLLAAGADRVIVTDEQSFEDAGETFDVVFDAIAGPLPTAVADAMNQNGRYVIYGLLSNEPATPYPFIQGILRDLTMASFHLGLHLMSDERRRADAFGWLLREAEHLTPVVDRTFELADLADAYRHMEASEHFGKIVVEVARP